MAQEDGYNAYCYLITENPINGRKFENSGVTNNLSSLLS